MTQIENTLITANGRITCQRCTAHSKRTGLQCRRPAMKFSRKLKCNFHGGKSSGPKTLEGKKKISNAHFVHGNETVKIRAQRQEKNTWFAHMEDVLHVLRMTTSNRSRGPKPNGYRPIKTVSEALQWAIDDWSHSNEGADGEVKIIYP